MANLPENPELEWAKNRRDPKDAIRVVNTFCRFCGKSPRELLELQTKALASADIDERDSVLILVEKYIENFKGRRTSKLLMLSYLRSFFEFHRRALPPTRRTWLKNLKNDRPKVEGSLSPDELQTIIRAVSGDPRKLSMILVQLQSFSGPRELRIIDNTMGVYIGERVKDGANLIDLHFTEGRKHSENPWHTYIGREACEALRRWFAVRGYPTKESPYIWPSLKPQTLGQGLTETAARQVFNRTIARLAIRPKIGSGKRTDRYGKSIKELRDLALSFSQQGVGKENEDGERFQESSAEYFAGHTVDELGYRKLHDLDPDYRKRQYQLVEPFLSPLSNAGNNHIRGRLEELEAERGERDKRITQLENNLKNTTMELFEMKSRYLEASNPDKLRSKTFAELAKMEEKARDLNDREKRELERLLKPNTKTKN